MISSTHGQHSVCLLIMPQFTYKPAGNMFLEEHALLNTLSNLSCNVDLPFQLLFDVKSKVATYFNEYLFGVCLATAGHMLFAILLVSSTFVPLSQQRTNVTSVHLLTLAVLSPHL